MTLDEFKVDYPKFRHEFSEILPKLIKKWADNCWHRPQAAVVMECPLHWIVYGDGELSTDHFYIEGVSPFYYNVEFTIKPKSLDRHGFSFKGNWEERIADFLLSPPMYEKILKDALEEFDRKSAIVISRWDYYEANVFDN